MGSLVFAFRKLAVITVSLPLFSFLFCILWSLLYNFKSSTATHCHVPNYLPSISSAIGGFKPQMYVWQVGIGLHATPRFLIVAMYCSFYKEGLHKEKLWQRLGILTSVLHAVENICLIGLTYVSSSDNHTVLLFIVPHKPLDQQRDLCTLSVTLTPVGGHSLSAQRGRI